MSLLGPLTSSLLHYSEDMKPLRFPQSWHDLNTAVDSGAVKLVAAPAALTKYLIFTYAITVACFVGLCLYYNLLTTNDFEVSDEYNLPGYTCRPLQKDPEYQLNITYDECMSKYYVDPTIDTLLLYGDYGSQGFGFYNTTTKQKEYISHMAGPWNFTSTMQGTLASSTTATVYHKPFPELTNQIFTYNQACKVPYYKGFDSSHPLWTDDILDYPLEHAVQSAALSPQSTGNGYGYYGLCNTNLNVPADYDWDETPLVFTPDANSDFVSQCGGKGNITSSIQDMIITNGTYVFVHAYSADNGLWIDCLDNSLTCKEGFLSISLRSRSIGMTTLYRSEDCRDYDEYGRLATGCRENLRPQSNNRCPYYEKEISRQAFEYVYGTENCHPCDSFKFNAPFYCEKKVHKGVAEIIALASSNSMAVLSLFIAAGPIVLLKFKASEEEEIENKSTDTI